MMTFTFYKDQDFISEHFRWSELACHDEYNSIISNPDVIFFTEVLMEEFREWYNRAIVPNSWYRTDPYNETVDGSPQSRHLKGVAVDIGFPAYDHDGSVMSYTRRTQFLENVRDKWYEILNKYGMTGGVGFYDWGFHIDAGNDTEDMRFWDYRGPQASHFTYKMATKELVPA